MNGKNAVILHKETLYYTNQKNQTVEKVQIKNIEKLPQLQQEFTEDCRLVQDRFLIEKIKEVTGYNHRCATEDSLSYAEFLDFAHKLFRSPFTSFSEFILQCVDSFNITMLSLLGVMFVSFCILVFTIAIPFTVIYNLCFDSVDDAKSNTLHLLDMFVLLGDTIIKATLSIPIQIGALLVRGGLTLLPTPENEMTNSEFSP
ncbi:hypothetical protein [Legionella sp.]|uniref:hypothetical protein n=1 Tax=Legionella sp. TaxID=459 RepID=UPI003C86BFC0